MERLPSEVEFASLLTYSPHGPSQIAARSRLVCQGIKVGSLGYYARAAQVAHQHRSVLARFLGTDSVLVPAPRSSPTRDPRDHWPARSICEALVAVGLGSAVLVGLRRTEAVPKSAFARPGERPSAQQHWESIAFDRPVSAPSCITVVDDVITKGATRIAAVGRVAAALPGTEVRAFALVRTMGLVPDIEDVIAPCVGRIEICGDRIVRDP